MTAAETIDASLAGRALVFGSLPPHGRDLDLLVRPAEAEAASRALADAGFTREGRAWRRDGEEVELIRAAGWALAPHALEALYEDAEQLADSRNLVQPCPRDVLLIAARRLVLGHSSIEKLRPRIDDAVARDPSAWAAARQAAPGWRLARALPLLEAAMRGEAVSAPARALAAAPLVVARRRRGAVVAFSGLDGSGKSSQATELVEALAQRGHDVVSEWNPVYNVFSAIPEPLKVALLRILGRRRAASPRASEAESVDRAGTVLREQPTPVAHAGATVSAVLAALAQRRATRRHLRRGRVVVVDRYTLDTVVHMRFRFGAERRFRAQALLVRALSPRPAVAFLLDISPETAMSRKEHHWTHAEFASQAELYRDEHARLGVIRLDGERPRGELRDEILAAVERALPS